MESTESVRAAVPPVKSLETHELVIKAEAMPGGVRVDWTGRSNARDPWSELRAYFESLAESLAGEEHTLEMHFEKLEYFNSSTITAVIRIMQLLQTKQVGLRLYYDASLRWQKLSFDGLKIFEQSHKRLEIREA